MANNPQTESINKINIFISQCDEELKNKLKGLYADLSKQGVLHSGLRIKKSYALIQEYVEKIIKNLKEEIEHSWKHGNICDESLFEELFSLTIIPKIIKIEKLFKDIIIESGGNYEAILKSLPIQSEIEKIKIKYYSELKESVMNYNEIFKKSQKIKLHNYIKTISLIIGIVASIVTILEFIKKLS